VDGNRQVVTQSTIEHQRSREPSIYVQWLLLLGGKDHTVSERTR
jgi:hypothetical protein